MALAGKPLPLSFVAPTPAVKHSANHRVPAAATYKPKLAHPRRRGDRARHTNHRRHVPPNRTPTPAASPASADRGGRLTVVLARGASGGWRASNGLLACRGHSAARSPITRAHMVVR